MTSTRKPYQGILNILRFNWHFYVIGVVVICALVISAAYLSDLLQILAYILGLLIAVSLLLSSLVSWFVYDRSGLYSMSWLPDLNQRKVLIINAGFDEISEGLQAAFPEMELTCADFYEPSKHTEVSIKRARKAYPLPSTCIPVSSTRLPFDEERFDVVISMLAAHEIREQAERDSFFGELQRVLKSEGCIYLTEHLRDIPNFLAYNIGCFHFHSRATWMRSFASAGLSLTQELKTTPFISTFILQKYGATS